jgi:hypothetical protein
MLGSAFPRFFPADAARSACHAALAAHKREPILWVLSQSLGNHAAAARAPGLQCTYLLRLLKALRVG